MPLAHELRGRVGMYCLIASESAIFSIFVVAYLFYAGKSLTGPYPNEVLHVPIFNSICLFGSSFTIVMAERALRRSAVKVFGIWWLFTIALGFIFLVGTAREWYQLIYHDPARIRAAVSGFVISRSRACVAFPAPLAYGQPRVARAWPQQSRCASGIWREVSRSL